MRRFLFLFLSAVTALALCTGGTASAQVPWELDGQLDSSAFTHQYNGDAYPVPDYTENNPSSWYPSTDGDILSWCTVVPDDGAPSPSFTRNDWASLVDDADGYTIEFRLKIGTDYDEGKAGSFLTYFGDGAGGRAQFSVGKEKLYWFQTGVIAADLDNTSDFHTYRLAQSAYGEKYSIWRDTEYIGTFFKSNPTGVDTFFWGDASGNVGGPTVYVDYVRFDNVGGYAPVGAESPKPGDTNFDDYIDGIDAGVVANNWLQATSLGQSAGDFNYNGVVNDLDAALMAANWTGPPPASSVPEPAAIVLLISAVFAIFSKKLRY